MSFTASQPDGSNDSLKSAISADGVPVLEQPYRVPARCGVAVKIAKDQAIEVHNTHGTQVCDFWAFCQPGLDEFLSMAHTRTSLSSVFPKVGDKIVTTSGIYGSITKLNDRSVQVQIADRVRVEMSRAAVGGYQGEEPVVQDSGSM